MNESRHIDVDTLNALIDGAVPATERPEIMRHLADCPTCQAELQELRAVSQLCAGLPQFIPLRAFTLGPEYRRPVVIPRVVQTLPVIRSLAIAAVLIFVLSSAFAMINTHQGSASSSDQGAPAPQNRAAVLVPSASQGEAPVATQPARESQGAAPAATQPAVTAVVPASPRQTESTGGRSLSGWWVASLIIGLGTALLLLAWFALDRGEPRRYSRLSRA